MALPGELGIRTRQIALVVERGVHYASLAALHGALTDAGAVVHFVGPRIGMFVGDSGEAIEANKSMENSPSVLFDALILPDGHTMEFIKDQLRHCKPILALGTGRDLLEMAGPGSALEDDPGILLVDSGDAAAIAPAFIDVIAAHRHPSRESDPPVV